MDTKRPTTALAGSGVSSPAAGPPALNDLGNKRIRGGENRGASLVEGALAKYSRG